MNKYIAIEFETGSGGSEIALRLSKKLSIPCYGREIMRMVSEEQGLSDADVRAYAQSITNSFLFSYYLFDRIKKNELSGLPQEGMICLEQQKKIKELAQKGSAIFIGHCASEFIKEYGGVIKVYIKADYDDRIKRLKQEKKSSDIDVGTMIKTIDGMQERYYVCNTGRRWNDESGYDLVLNTSQTDIEECIQAIASKFCDSVERNKD